MNSIGVCLYRNESEKRFTTNKALVLNCNLVPKLNRIEKYRNFLGTVCFHLISNGNVFSWVNPNATKEWGNYSALWKRIKNNRFVCRLCFWMDKESNKSQVNRANILDSSREGLTSIIIIHVTKIFIENANNTSTSITKSIFGFHLRFQSTRLCV